MPNATSHGLLERMPPSQLEHPVVRAGWDCWTRLQGGRAFLARSEITPRALGHLLANTTLVKVIPEKDDFELRFAGDAITRAFRAPVHGHRLSDLSRTMPIMTEPLRGQYREVVDTRNPQGWRYTAEDDLDEITYSVAESLVLPLSGDGDAVDHILGFTGFPA
ncbi:PAS domain-containing protein [Rhizomicrobium electricum]|uniref:PAS domain-containing protein n=1 Tax=Rhizomicrobium electricum TaxID=480070 RepID=A0ABP3PCZ3_9PROT|nr:PAS domain-containing protein [Rhizomicrobium electricum]NIJ47925.1 hypothetical protein [Rhizomicrobium electricum]